MFSQLFGNYLVDKGLIGIEDYRAAAARQLDVRVKLGTIAVAEGVLTQAQVDALNRMQLQLDRRFGDLAVEKGFLTEGQLRQLLQKQGNPYLQFLQVLLESGKVNVPQLDAQLGAFQREKGFSDSDMAALKNDDFNAIVPLFAFSSKPFVTEICGLVLRNINRFVTRDFHIGQIRHVGQLEYRYLAGQHSTGDYDLHIALAEEEDNGAFALLASAFAGEQFERTDADVLDAVCEFVNCNSGLFASDISSGGFRMEMEPAYAYEGQAFVGNAYALPVYIENRKLQLLVAVDSEVEMGQAPCEMGTGKIAVGHEADSSKCTVLVVDDTRMSRKLLRTILEEGGFAVIAEAANGEEGVEAYKQFHPAIVTMDITMPKKDGIEALKEIKAYDRDARVVMITAAGQQHKVIDALRLGAEKFIVKPFELGDVLATVQSMVKQHK